MSEIFVGIVQLLLFLILHFLNSYMNFLKFKIHMRTYIVIGGEKIDHDSLSYTDTRSSANVLPRAGIEFVVL